MKIISQGYVTDMATGAVDRIPLEPQDWNARIHAGCQMELPKDRAIWIVTEDGEAHEVAYSDAAKLYLHEDWWDRQDGESGQWQRDEIVGWTDDYEDAEEAAALFTKATWGGQ